MGISAIGRVLASSGAETVMAASFKDLFNMNIIGIWRGLCWPICEWVASSFFFFALGQKLQKRPLNAATMAADFFAPFPLPRCRAQGFCLAEEE
jgi:hypothetical protein